jgi:hypothetical protein
LLRWQQVRQAALPVTFKDVATRYQVIHRNRGGRNQPNP